MHPIAVTDSQTVSANDAYVLNIVPLSATYAISTSVVEGQPNTIGLYDKTSLRHIGSFKGHGDGVTCLKRTQSTDPGLGSCGRDGVVKIWDERVRPDAESARCR
jgi:WD40 repeat protein